MTLAVRNFMPEVEEVRAARQFAQSAAERWGISADEIVLVVGELAANSQCHARSGFSVCLDYTEGTLLVEVTDASPRFPRVLTPSSDAKSGRGLIIVERIARSWGARPASGGGKTVWVELDAEG